MRSSCGEGQREELLEHSKGRGEGLGVGEGKRDEDCVGKGSTELEAEL